MAAIAQKAIILGLIQERIAKLLNPMTDSKEKIDPATSDPNTILNFKDGSSFSVQSFNSLFRLFCIIMCIPKEEITESDIDGLHQVQLKELYKAVNDSPDRDEDFCDFLLNKLLTRK